MTRGECGYAGTFGGCTIQMSTTTVYFRGDKDRKRDYCPVRVLIDKLASMFNLVLNTSGNANTGKVTCSEISGQQPSEELWRF